MDCPACNTTNMMRWMPPRYECRECGHELAKREYQREVENDWDNWLASPPDSFVDSWGVKWVKVEEEN